MRVLCSLLVGCASSPPPVDPLSLLQVGVDPHAEADAVEAQLEGFGFERAARVRGRTFDALDLRRAETAQSAIRVTTRRGIALALDAPSPHHQRMALRLEDVGVLDVDGDGAEDVLVSAHDAAFDRRCIAIVRIDPEGSVREVTPDLSSLDAEACVERVVPFGARYAAIVVARYPTLSRGSVPSVAIAYLGPSWEPVRSAAYWAAERQARVDGLTGSDVDARYRLAVELALVARFAGEGTQQQLREFESALSGVAWTPNQEADLESVRSLIRSEWRAPCDPEC